MNPDRWLTPKRLRTHGLLLVLVLWGVYIWTLATPGLSDQNGNLKGTDFLHFYVLGSLAIEHRGSDLYDINRQAALAAQRVPSAAGVRYLPLYPPHVSLLFTPFAYFSYGSALVVWWISTALIYAVCCYLFWRISDGLRKWGWTVAILCAAYPAFFHLIAWGQTSALALACFTAAFFLLRNRRDFSAGILLGCLIFKPQFGLALAIVFVATGAWRILMGAALSAAAQLACGGLYYGRDSLRGWIRTLAKVPTLLPAFEPRPYHTHCLRTFWSMLIPSDGFSFALYVLSAGIVLAWTISIWKSRESLSVRYAALLIATVLVSPHLTVYDLVILAPAIVLLVDWMITKPAAPAGFGTVLYSVYMLPLLGPFTRWTHVELSVVAMVALLYLIWRMRTRRNSARIEASYTADAHA